MPATTVSCERSCSRSRPRFTAPRTFSKLTSSVERIESAQSSISSRVSPAWRRAHGRPPALGLGPPAARRLAGLGDHSVDLPLRLGGHLLPLLDDPPRL